MTNIEGLIAFDDMPLCPLCDQPIFRYEPHVVVTAINTVALAHQDCVQQAQEGSGDE